MIELSHVSKKYKDGAKTQALEDVSLKIEDGEFVFLIGDSGAGKSTLIKLLLGMERPTEGRILVDGIDVGRLAGRKLPRYRRRFGVIFQDFRLLPGGTVYDNLAFAQRVVSTSRSAMKKRIPKVLAQVGLEEKAGSLPDQLSGGEKQRCALARAVVNGPLYLLADEPTGNLDPANTEDVMQLLDLFNRGGTTVVVITHDSALVDRMRRRVITLKDGHLVSDVQKGGYEQDA